MKPDDGIPEEKVDAVARIVFPGAFDRAAFEANANIYTQSGDFERRQHAARLRVVATLRAAAAWDAEHAA